jgi:hypothetical protein
MESKISKKQNKMFIVDLFFDYYTLAINEKKEKRGKTR